MLPWWQEKSMKYFKSCPTPAEYKAFHAKHFVTALHRAAPSSTGHRSRLPSLCRLAPAVDFLRVYDGDGGDVDDVFHLRASRQQVHRLAHSHENGSDCFQTAD